MSLGIHNRLLSSILTEYSPVVQQKTDDYYPGGMLMPGRHSSSADYRFGYNGMEMDNEPKGNGNSYTTEFRQYDPRLMRWLSLDPLMMQFPWMSPYVAFDNNPIYYTDPYGLSAGGPPENEGTTIGETQMSDGSEWIWTKNEDSDNPFWAKLRPVVDAS